MANGFYFRLAFQNIKRNHRKLLPYYIAASLMISIYFMVVMILYSPGMGNIPDHVSLKRLFFIGLQVLHIFIAIFLFYINSFLIKQRKKELGLYGILGLEKRHVGYVMLWENLLVNGAATLTGIISGCVFGWLIFMLLMKCIHVSENSYFAIPGKAFVYTICYNLFLFLLIFVVNLRQIRVANPIDLLKSDHQGEKKSRFLVPMTFLGLVALGTAYYLALTVTNPLMAINKFFMAVLLVIIATYMLFTSGSIFLLNFLKKRKGFYYQPDNFVSVSGMLHRMKQNASGLASICILSTMLLVTVSTCIALFMGQEDILASKNKDDVTIAVTSEVTEAQDSKLKDLFLTAAAEQKVTKEEEYSYNTMDFMLLYQDGKMTTPASGSLDYYKDTMEKLVDVSAITLEDFNRITGLKEVLKDDDQVILLSGGGYEEIKEAQVWDGNQERSYEITSHRTDTVFTNGKNRKAEDQIYLVVKDSKVQKQMQVENTIAKRMYILNISGGEENCYHYSEQLRKNYSKIVLGISFESIYSDRAFNYSFFGGLLFMGAFFTILFLCATVLIIYFKQISEGYEDKERFEMLQKVGMDDREVKRTINKQILIVFFLPLLGALLHLSVASPMIIKMLGAFMLYNTKLTALCMAGSSAVFTIVYVIVYRITARTYCRIVKW